MTNCSSRRSHRPCEGRSSPTRFSRVPPAAVLGYADLGGGVTEVRFTLPGDANLDAKGGRRRFVGALATNYGTTSGGVWTQGDFDYKLRGSM